MRKIFFIVIVGIVLSLFNGQQLYAGEIDVLVDKLVEKGILTQIEAQIILDETRKEVAKKLAEGKSHTVPKWAQTFRLSGDLRTRYQYERREGEEERHRARIRFRLRSEMKVTDRVRAKAGLASGGADPRSTEETLDNTFETPDIRLDYAYAEYLATPWLTLKGGKIRKIPFWVPAQLLWDGDINPDGVFAQLTHPLYPNLELFFNTGLFFVDEIAREDTDPLMYVFQPGFTAKLGEDVDLETAVTFYDFDNVRGRLLDHRAGTNTTLVRRGVTGLKYDYDSIGLGSELAFNNPFGLEEFLPHFAIIGEYIYNPDPADNTGFLLGCEFGDKRVRKQGEWQGEYSYRRLERDAFLDAFPHSTFYRGATNVKGHEVAFRYGLLDDVILGLTYFHAEPIEGVIRRSERLLQTDILYRF